MNFVKLTSFPLDELLAGYDIVDEDIHKTEKNDKGKVSFTLLSFAI